MYLNSVTVVGFVGADPEQRQAKSNGAKFTVLSVATQRSWKNAQDEWSSKTEWHRVCIFRPRLADYVLQSIKKGSHVLDRGQPHQLDLRASKRQRQERRRPRRSRRGPFAPMSCEGSTAANLSRKESLPRHMFRTKLPKRRRTLPTNAIADRAPALCRGPFFVLAATPTKPNKSSASCAPRSRIRPLREVCSSDHACGGNRSRSMNVRARFPKTPGVVPLPA